MQLSLSLDGGVPDFYFHLIKVNDLFACSYQTRYSRELWSGFAKFKFGQQRAITDFPPFLSMRFEMA